MTGSATTINLYTDSDNYKKYIITNTQDYKCVPYDSTRITIYTTSFKIHKFYVLPTQLYLCVLCGSENKQRLFPYTSLTDWFL